MSTAPGDEPGDEGLMNALWYGVPDGARDDLRALTGLELEMRLALMPWWEGGSAHDQRTPEWNTYVLRTLKALEHPSPEQLRRIAELTDLLHTEDDALPWWQKAAEAGDEASHSMVELLLQERLNRPQSTD